MILNYRNSRILLALIFVCLSTIQCVGSAGGGSDGANNSSTGNNQTDKPTLVSEFGRASMNTEGELNFPSGVTVDSTGNVYVCSVSGDMISKFDDQGNFLTRWQTPDCFGIEADDSDNIYVASKFRDKMLKYDSDGILLLEWGSQGNGNGQFRRPNDVAINRARGWIYVADSENLRVQVFDTNGIFKFKWGSSGTGDGQFKGSRGPLGIAVDQNSEEVYVTDSDARRMQKFDKDGNFLMEWGSTGTNAGEFRWPRNVDVDNSNGNVYVVDGDNERIQVFDSSGNFIREFQGLHNEDDGPFHPRDVAVDSQNGFIYAAATYANRIDKFDAAVDTPALLPQSNGSENYLLSWGFLEHDNGVFNGPSGMSIDLQGGYIYVADKNNFIIQKFDLNGKYQSSTGYSGRVYTIYNGGDGSFDFPASIANDDNGNLYVLRDDAYYPGDPEMKRIQKFNQNGVFTLGWNYSPGINLLHAHQMQGVVYNPLNGYVYVSNAYYNTVQCFDNSGSGIPVLEFGGTGNIDGKFNFPSRIAVDRVNGNIYVIDLGNSRIQKFTHDGIYLMKWGTRGTGVGDELKMDQDSGIYVDTSERVYVADSLNNQVKVFDANGNFILKIKSGGKPSGIVVDSQGYIYIADYWNNRVRKYSPVP
jgi:tripartite motif-containing protein 71